MGEKRIYFVSTVSKCVMFVDMDGLQCDYWTVHVYFCDMCFCVFVFLS